MRLIRLVMGLAVGIICQFTFAQQDPSRECIELTYRAGATNATTVAEVVRRYSDGSILAQVPDGSLLSLDSNQVVATEPRVQAMQSLSDDELITQLRKQLGGEFRFYKTKHFIIAYKTSQIYAEWVGQLFERFYRAFHNDWNSRGFPLVEPRFPLVAIVFSDKASYLAFAHADVGESAQAMIGYYNMNTNRMIMYDLTGVDGLVPANERVASRTVIDHLLAQPQAERTVATVVHEAVHQLAFNAGLQVRLADNPLWLSEGLAMYFEAPDLNNPQGWRIGNINYHNLRLFMNYLKQRPEDSLITLIRDDNRFKSTNTVAPAYSESWALTFFLMKTRKKQFTQYMKQIAQLEPLGDSQAEVRLEMFEQHFGDLNKLQRDFINYIRRLRP